MEKFGKIDKRSPAKYKEVKSQMNFEITELFVYKGQVIVTPRD